MQQVEGKGQFITKNLRFNHCIMFFLLWTLAAQSILWWKTGWIVKSISVFCRLILRGKSNVRQFSLSSQKVWEEWQSTWTL